MGNKRGAAWLAAALLGAALLIMGGVAAWRWMSPKAAPVEASAGPSPGAAAAAAAPALEASVRAWMPGAGLFRQEWLLQDKDGWNLRIPRLRDPKALGDSLRAHLERAGLKPGVFEWRDFPQWRGFYLELGAEHLVAVQDRSPGLALVLDDWGYHTKVLDAMKSFPAHLTIAVLPGLPYSAVCAEAAFSAGHEVILHLPMEPLRRMPMIKGTLMVGMPEAEVLSWMDRHAATVPHMVGLNNHEGSKGSADTALMRTVCSWVRSKGEYFLDSKTISNSVGVAEAMRAGIPYAARRVFLDNQDDPGAIEAKVREALAVAKRTGSCVAIGHAKENTMAVLTRMAPELIDSGVDLVRVSDLTRYEIPPDAP
jgi:polysaccharide deacetylase 2 family uncharacterized protein YibQ